MKFWKQQFIIFFAGMTAGVITSVLVFSALPVRSRDDEMAVIVVFVSGILLAVLTGTMVGKYLDNNNS
jgi:hypothetical protein